MSLGRMMTTKSLRALLTEWRQFRASTFKLTVHRRGEPSFEMVIPPRRLPNGDEYVQRAEVHADMEGPQKSS